MKSFRLLATTLLATANMASAAKRCRCTDSRGNDVAAATQAACDQIPSAVYKEDQGQQCFARDHAFINEQTMKDTCPQVGHGAVSARCYSP
ncbi:hypothetical protein EJ03DRAFT_325130 [Teratosphaeria nubilosa]|uniref:Uncharacterized protein n=1 Tax=Teratosphaeria nubilosa TaxID=161662 RepID=A0A6G1LHH6_9PEZI|nr:hypothetical protein EJ03DRAFT_325130 [Teratosphaeria nubilosa]